MLDYPNFLHHIRQTKFARFRDQFEQAINFRLEQRPWGEQALWDEALNKMPPLEQVLAVIDQDTLSLTSTTPLSTTQESDLLSALKALHPWRKGPFNIFGQFIDTEWRSDWKWQRIAPHISDLTGRSVLDIGCGSGYHCWRMRGAGAELVVGIEPMMKYLYQFQMLKRYLPEQPVFVLPLICEDLPQTKRFDTVFSMGVLYHRKSPFEHLEELRASLRHGGELVLETLVVDGDSNTVLVPQGRYASMPNVWFLPSALCLESWLQRLGFKQVRTVNIDQTSTQEQRSTDWMTYQSLADFLDPSNQDLTIEGHPAPKRATIIAEAP